MRAFIFVCGALLVFAIAYALFSSAPDVLSELSGSQLRPTQIAWMFIIVVSLIVLACAVWSNEKLLQQRNATQTLQSRLHLEEAQKDVDRAVSQLARTVPDAAIGALQQRLVNAEKQLSVQQQRNGASELQSLVEELRARQSALREKLGDAITKRRSLEQLFAEYEGTQHDIERTLSGIEEDKKGDSLEVRIGNLSQFIKVTDTRFEELERSKQMLLHLKEEFDALQTRLLPLKDDRSGVKALIHQLNDMCAQLGANIDALDREGDTSLSERVKKIAETRQALSERISSVAEELSKLDNSHKDINTLFTRLSNELTAR